MQVQFSPAAIGLVLAGFLSWFFARFPSVSVWFAGKTKEEKSLWTIGIILGLFALIIASGATGIIQWLTMSGAIMVWHPIPWSDIIITLGAIVFSNQSVYLLIPDSAPVAAAKAARDMVIPVIAKDVPANPTPPVTLS